MLDYLPEYAHLFDADKERITIEHCLMMAAGLEWNEVSVLTYDSNNDNIAGHRVADYVADVPYTSGYGGQHIFVVPELDLVAVTAADYSNTSTMSQQSRQIMDLIEYRILPAALSGAVVTDSPDPNGQTTPFSLLRAP